MRDHVEKKHPSETPSTYASAPQPSSAPTTSVTTLNCKYCQRQFTDAAALAEHEENELKEFEFLHQTMEPETIITKANWLKAWKAKWKRPRVPQPLWPNPPATVASVNTGKKTLCQSWGSNAMSMSEQGDLQP